MTFAASTGPNTASDLRSKRLTAIVRRCQELPGQKVFQYLDEDGQPRGVDSDDVNELLRKISGEEITAKGFRTWAATSLAALAFRELEAFDTQTRAKRNIVNSVETIAKLLGNAPAICANATSARPYLMATWMAHCSRHSSECGREAGRSRFWPEGRKGVRGGVPQTSVSEEGQSRPGRKAANGTPARSIGSPRPLLQVMSLVGTFRGNSTGVLSGTRSGSAWMAAGSWRDNVFIGRLWRSVKYEEVLPARL